MKYCCLLVIFSLLLCGCGAEQTLETIADEVVAPVMAQPRQISVQLPDNAVAPVLESDSRQIYMSEHYEITVETLSAGDLNATVQALSGYEKDQLTLVQTESGDAKRYDFVWVSAGESGERLGRGVILDDGQYHYCMSVLRDEIESQTVWSEVFQSFSLT